jgi:hypothetical protein
VKKEIVMRVEPVGMNIQGVVREICNFLAYVGDFYAEGGVYDMGATSRQILDAFDIYANRVGYENLALDSVDREGVRDVMIEQFGLVFPNEA